VSNNFNTPWQGITQHLAEKEQIGQNSARPADSMIMFDSRSSGEIQHPDVLSFETTFVEEPVMSYGYRIDEEEGDELVVGQFPRCTGFVFDWRRNTKGFYLGAFVGVCIDVPTGSETPSYFITHYFRFQGIAIKDLPADEVED
jgi:hypothetical protein